jgi:hypothetical protein
LNQTGTEYVTGRFSCDHGYQHKSGTCLFILWLFGGSKAPALAMNPFY